MPRLDDNAGHQGAKRGTKELRGVNLHGEWF